MDLEKCEICLQGFGDPDIDQVFGGRVTRPIRSSSSQRAVPETQHAFHEVCLNYFVASCRLHAWKLTCSLCDREIVVDENDDRPMQHPHAVVEKAELVLLMKEIEECGSQKKNISLSKGA